MVVKRSVISIVDDNVSLRKALKRLFESAGLLAEDFESAEHFLFCSSHNTSCLILDVQLPGMSGLELQNYLEVSNRRIPIIFVFWALR